MRTADLHFFDLPPGRIAQRPATPRDAARLLVVERATGSLTHATVRDLPGWLRPGDLLVRNDTRVLPARFEARRATGARIAGLYVAADGAAAEAGWRVLLKPSARLRCGELLELTHAPQQRIELLERRERGAWRVAPRPPVAALDLLERVGQTPLPPYIRHGRGDADDRERYQTIYARSAGSVAAPTAGLHFTPELQAAIAQREVDTADVTLHVGPGTFLPVTADRLADHAMHSEWYEVGGDTAARLAAATAAGRRIVAVGTTAARVLESLEPPLRAVRGETRIFIYPPYAFRHVGALLTNFHLPGSTLLALVMALAGADLTRRAYAAAIAENYRFYSYGDAMLIV